MTANTSPVFGLTANIGHCRLAAANTASDGSGTLGTLFTAGANGSLIHRVRAMNSQASAAASSAMVIRLFLTDNAGANPRLFREFAVPTVTRSTTVVGAALSIDFPGGLFIPTGTILKVVQSIYAGAQDQMDYTAEGEDL